MKTIKIPKELHKDLILLKAKHGLKTIAETIRFLEIYYKTFEKERKNDSKE